MGGWHRVDATFDKAVNTHLVVATQHPGGRPIDLIASWCARVVVGHHTHDMITSAGPRRRVCEPQV